MLTRYDKLGRDVSRVEHHPDWLANLDEVFDYGLVGWNHDPTGLQRHGRAPVPLLAAFDYLVGQADMALCCPPELATAPSPCWSASPPSSNATNCCPRSSRPASGG
ncbi:MULTISPECIES: hypothetical protein [Mycolicibacterium]|uniref:hypothetical protein n=1 Tax=Mycolicibacterium TaxID=1866885 RepID=UPI0013016D04